MPDEGCLQILSDGYQKEKEIIPELGKLGWSTNWRSVLNC